MQIMLTKSFYSQSFFDDQLFLRVSASLKWTNWPTVKSTCSSCISEQPIVRLKAFKSRHKWSRERKMSVPCSKTWHRLATMHRHFFPFPSTWSWDENMFTDSKSSSDTKLPVITISSLSGLNHIVLSISNQNWYRWFLRRCTA